MANKFKHKYPHSRYKYKHNRKPANQDNKGYYAGWKAAPSWATAEDPNEFPGYDWNIRVPSLKRGRSTWKRFYKLFPHLKYQDTCCGYPLKKI